MGTNRRIFLKNTLLTTLVGLVTSSSLLKWGMALANTWPADLFNAKTVRDALGGHEGSASSDIVLKANEPAENGAVVQVTVESALPGIESIALLVKDNPHPLSAVFLLGPGVQANITTRIKMSRTSEVIAVAKVGDQYFSTTKEVQVIVGGCGE